MDRRIRERIAMGVPLEVSELEADGPLAVSQLWVLARSYSKLRHRSSPRREPAEHRRFERLKIHCVRKAVARGPDLFLVFLDPGFPHLWLIYHRVERNLLHIPVAIGLGQPDRRDNGPFQARTAHVQVPPSRREIVLIPAMATSA
jgi:hypothetical protein